MRRFFLNALTALSVLLLAAAVALWFGAYRGSPSPVWYEQQALTETRFAIVFGPGEVQFDVMTPLSNHPPGDFAAVLGFGYLRSIAYAKRIGGGPDILLGDVSVFFVSYWMLMVLGAILPLWRVVPIVRRKFSTPPGHCRRCGYDLRASPQRCPECGTTTTGTTTNVTSA